MLMQQGSYLTFWQLLFSVDLKNTGKNGFRYEVKVESHFPHHGICIVYHTLKSVPNPFVHGMGEGAEI